MKAIVHTSYGAPSEVLAFREIDTPKVAEGEVLVRIKATSAAAGDWLVARGYPYFARPMFGGFRSPRDGVAGTAFAGVVSEVGVDVVAFAAGDEVFGWSDGAFAEYVSSPVEQLAPKPANVTFEEAAAVPDSAFAALQSVRDAGGVSAGQEVLVIGASGGVGSFAVQVAKSLGAMVTGVASTRHIELVRSLGADHVIDYTSDDFTRSGKQYDVIIDTAGNRSLSDLRRALTPKGTLVIVGGRGGRVTMGFGRTVRAMVLSPFVGQRLSAFFASPNHDDLVVLAGLLESGAIKPAIGDRYALAEAAAAVASVEAGHAHGKTIVTV